MKSTLYPLLLPIVFAGVLLSEGCSKTTITIENYETSSGSSGNDGGDSDTTTDGTDNTTNLVAFHATLESLNMTRSMSPISTNTLVTIYAFHGDTDNATSTAPMARGNYVAQQAGMLTGVSDYKMYLSNGVFDFYAVSTNSSARFPTISNGISSGLQNGVDYLWWGCANYEIDGSQVTVPIVFNHAATQIVIVLSAGEGVALQQIASATITPPQTGSTLDLTSGAITPATGYGSTPASMGVNGLKAQYTMLPLQTDTPMTLTLMLNINYDPTPRQYTVSIPVPEGGFQGGNSYLYQAIVDANTVTFPSVDVNDWNTVDESGNPLSPH
ncbi:MAG TPA: fimbrillin family protein [Candidatus Alistipes intestinipullorum]|nr:fimbrillin family protein [Candidatus Alistipes intestinipullorum]